MKKFYFYFIILVSFFISPIILTAQITITPSVAASVMAAKLTGPGVLIISPTLTCASNAYGTFSGTSVLSFDSGIVLTNGQAQTSGSSYGAGGPASNFASTANGTPGSALLTTLAGEPTYDACILEFDFRPTGDTIKFQYVFGSEEYTDYTCSSFNDVFGFFITGPGYSSPTNLALVPGTTIPVCINSVNCGATGGYSTYTCSALGAGSPFCAYYVNNISGPNITYDGLTTTLTAIAAVTPCDTYHLKIGIADASDEVFDSGVFLKAGSLRSISFTAASIGIDPSDTGYGSQYCIRGCSPGKFVFTNTGLTTDSLKIHYTIGGTAVSGVDYTPIPDSITIHAGATTDTEYIYGLTTGTGTKTVTLYILSPFACSTGSSIIDSIELTIYDSVHVHIITPDTSICIGQSVLINASGIPLLHYVWSPSSTLSSSTILTPTATPTVTTTYTVTATLPGSGCPPSSDHITISIVLPPTLDVGTTYKTTCVDQPLPVEVTVTPAGTYSYSWTPSSTLSSSTIANPIITPTAGGNFEYVVQVSTGMIGCVVRDSFLLHVSSNNFTLVSSDTGVCYPPGTYSIVAYGDSGSTYNWSPSAGVSNPAILDPTITPGGNMTYTVTSSYPGCPDIVRTILYYVEHPVVNIIPSDTTICADSPVTIPVVAYPADSPVTIRWTPGALLSDSTILQPNFYSSVKGDFYYNIYIQSPLGCISTDDVHFHVSFNYLTLVSKDTGVCYPSGSYQIVAYGDSSSSYNWSPAAGVSNPTILDPIITPPGNMTYTITVTNPGCPTKTGTIFYYIEHPFVNIIPSDTSFCIGSPVTIPAITYPVDSPYIPSWTPATLLSDPSILEPNFFSPVIGDFYYHLTIQSSLGCTSTDSVHLHVVPNDFTIFNPDTGICYPPGNYQIVGWGDSEFNYTWTPATGVSNPNILEPTVSPSVTTVYTVTGTFPGCPDMVHYRMYYIENPVVNIVPADTSFCIAYPVPIQVIVSPSDSPYTFTWSPVTLLSDPTMIEPSFFSSDTGAFTYHIIIQSNLGCTSKDSVILRPSLPPVIKILPGNSNIPYGDHIQLQVVSLSPFNLVFYWIPDNGTLSNPNISDPIATPTDTITNYKVYVRDAWGCLDSSTVTITLDYPVDCIPSAFTPNNDGMNDIFRLCSFMQYEKLVEFKIFNRWGQMVYENTNDPTKGWDGFFNGVPQDIGVYNYVVIIEKPDKTTKVFKGDVTLLR